MEGCFSAGLFLFLVGGIKKAAGFFRRSGFFQDCGAVGTSWEGQLRLYLG